MGALLPNLPDETVEFIYPQATITTIADMIAQFAASWAATKATAQDIEELFNYDAGADNTDDVIVPHVYYVERDDGSFGTLDIVSCMCIQLGLEMALDLNGEAPKLISYLVNIQNASADDASDEIAATRMGALSDNDTKSFAHQWFANTDARDVGAMVAMTSSGPPNMNLLGAETGSRAELQGYMKVNIAAQSWAVHQPTNIRVTHTDEVSVLPHCTDAS